MSYSFLLKVVVSLFNFSVMTTRLSLSDMERLVSSFPTTHFEVVVEAMKIVARERGDFEAASFLAECERKFEALRERSKVEILA